MKNSKFKASVGIIFSEIEIKKHKALSHIDLIACQRLINGSYFFLQGIKNKVKDTISWTQADRNTLDFIDMYFKQTENSLKYYLEGVPTKFKSEHKIMTDIKSFIDQYYSVISEYQETTDVLEFEETHHQVKTIKEQFLTYISLVIKPYSVSKEIEKNIFKFLDKHEEYQCYYECSQLAFSSIEGEIERLKLIKEIMEYLMLFTKKHIDFHSFEGIPYNQELYPEGYFPTFIEI
ncbi:hypothetical protein HN014_22275 (plasmid) [Aquimarina sp. TRL1]|uniref:hypothetical protein n=1 Tax=Aquimarina sp. (strain TRL1) TaxID=2736252 RepID=UPI00158EEC6C|nr:hypothetical protein [Aquimarina sp. TRL1]QKX07729.1 hypothetical protein HN014_22275 [Aquimarina sp. TRL1]